jgi:hypothetical protein
MKLEIEIPDHMAKLIQDYLEQHPEENIYGIVKEAMEIKFLPKDTTKLLELAGVFKEPSPRLTEQSDQQLQPDSVGAFLDFISEDAQKNPDRIRQFDPDLLSRAQLLVEGVEVDLDASLDQQGNNQ